MHGDVLRFAFLIRHDTRNSGLAKFQLGFDTEKLLRTCDEGAVEREADIAGFKELDDFVFFALVFQIELVLVVEGRLCVLVDVEVDFVADFGYHIHLDVHIHDEITVPFPLFAARGVVAVGAFVAEGQVDGALWADVDGVAAEDGLEGFASYKHGRDDGVAVSSGTGVLAAAFLPILLYSFFVLILKVFVLSEGGGGVIVEVTDAALEGVLARHWVVDDFCLVVAGVVEIKWRMVVEVLDGIAGVDGDGVDDFVCVGLHREGDIGVGKGKMRKLGSRQSRKWQGCEQGEKDEEGMSFHQILQCYILYYSTLSASLIRVSTEASGICLKSLSRVLSTAVLLKPNIVNADNASVLIVLFGVAKISVGKSFFFSLSFKSMTIRCAVFKPIPFTD